jgi:hypothetical protein
MDADAYAARLDELRRDVDLVETHGAAALEEASGDEELQAMRSFRNRCRSCSPASASRAPVRPEAPQVPFRVADGETA